MPKDPNAPKRPVTAYIIFSTEVRQKLHSDQPEMGFVELMRHIGGLWNKLPAEDKQVNTSYVKPFMSLFVSPGACSTPGTFVSGEIQ